MYTFDNFKYDIYVCVFYLHSSMVHWSLYFFRYLGSHIIKANGGFIQKKKIHTKSNFSGFRQNTKGRKMIWFLIPNASIFKCKVTIINVCICIEPGENANFKLFCLKKLA